jgi:Recombination endonuclease VII
VDHEVCGEWMPRKQTTCARGAGHPPGQHATAEAMENHRVRRRARPRNDPPEAKAKWRRTYRLAQYGLTEEDFARMLKEQGYACAMGGEPFKDGDLIFIDHDHACCPDEKRSCGRCVRGLLCLGCNVALGHIERYSDLARAYLDKSKTPRPQGSEGLRLASG